MILRDIITKQEYIDDYNDRCEKFKTEYPEYDWERQKIDNIYDKFQPYNEWIKYLHGYLEHNGLDWNLVKDRDSYSIDNVFVGELNEHLNIREFTDYKIIRDNWRQEDYGVCDNAEQAIEIYEQNIASGRFSEDIQYLIYLTPMYKHNQPEDGGWRWEKWGEYIGVQNSQSDYLYYEPEVDMIYVFHIRGLE